MASLAHDPANSLGYPEALQTTHSVRFFCHPHSTHGTRSMACYCGDTRGVCRTTSPPRCHTHREAFPCIGVTGGEKHKRAHRQKTPALLHPLVKILLCGFWPRAENSMTWSITESSTCSELRVTQRFIQKLSLRLSEAPCGTPLSWMLRKCNKPLASCQELISQNRNAPRSTAES